MDDMVEVVIRLPKEYHDKIIKARATEDDNMLLAALLAVREGTVLPKGHGRLIDVDAVNVNETIGGKNEFADCIREAVQMTLNNAPTIIETDRGDNG